MTKTIHFRLKAAYDVAPGQTILRNGENGVEVCVKGERVGKEFVRHYLAPLVPKPGDDAALYYLDPEDEVAVCSGQLRISLGDARDVPVASGCAFVNGRGTYLRLDEHARFHGHKALSYLDMATGDVRSRQEKGITAVHPDWTVVGVDLDGETVPVDVLCAAFADSSVS